MKLLKNLFQFGNNKSLFIRGLDFVSIMPGIPKAKVKSRIVLTPQTCKSFEGQEREIFIVLKSLMAK
jgi:hypothetical protein